MFLILGPAWKKEMYHQKMSDLLSNGENKM
jgi:hypothetical protein